MNTIRSTWFGWGSLCLAGGGAYVLAKRAVNADRAARHEDRVKRKEEALQRERETSIPTAPSISRNTEAIKPPIPVSPTPSAAQNQPHTRHTPLPDDVANPSQEAAHDPAPTRHEPETDAQRESEKGKYEATEPFRSRKGNRFS